MQINLRAHGVNRMQAAKIALADAIIWLWLHQANYDSLFTASFIEPAMLALPSFVLSGALVIGITWARWDRIPRTLRVGTALAAAAVGLGLTLLPQLPAAPEFAHAALVLGLAVLCGFAALLRLETLAKCDDFSTLSVALSGSLLLFYLLNLVLLLVPRPVYDFLVVMAPLAMLFGTNTPAPSCKRLGPLPKKVRLSPPSIAPCLTGAATGLVVALGTVSMATSPGQLFAHPAPLFLISQLLFIMLGVITAFGIDLRKASYFALLNFSWGFGIVAGTLVRDQFPLIPEALLVDLSSFVCLLTLVGFFAFSGVWINTLGRTASMGRETALEEVAQEAGLTKRETEVTALLLEGRSLRIVQQELFISEGTARTHAKRIYAKLGVHSKQELIDYFKRHLPEG